MDNDITAYDVACYLSALNDTNMNTGDVLTNLKLQKLVYYVQGYYLAIKGTALFKDSIYAWQYGPVVPTLYNKLKKFINMEVKVKSDKALDTLFNSEQKQLMEEVFKQYAQFSAWKLRDMTHQESPWKDTELQKEITPDKMEKFFKTQLSN